MSDFKDRTKKIVKTIGKGTLDAGIGAINTLKGGLEGVVAANTFPYALPTVMRTIEENKTYDKKPGSVRAGNALGFIAGLRLTALQGAIYLAAFQNGQKYWLIPVATNLMSGLYEYIRNNKHQAYSPEMIGSYVL